MRRLLRLTSIVAIGLVGHGSPARAVAVGDLKVSSASGAIELGLNSISWPWGSNFVTATGTNVAYDTGTLTVGNSLSIQTVNLSAQTIVGFMTFTAHPGLTLDLQQLGPGMANTNCRTARKIGSSCSPVTGSPWILTRAATGTTITFSATGQARDLSNISSNWNGVFTTQVTALPGVSAGQVVTPADVQDYFAANSNATIIGAFSADLSIFFTP